VPGIKTFHLTYCPYHDIIEKLKDLVVLDIFAGSNTTGAVAESSSRRWIAFEKQQDYLVSSAFRFLDNMSESEIKAIYEQLRGKGTSNVRLPQRIQAELPL
jgi:adenine specific DNA methylase Mod